MLTSRGIDHLVLAVHDLEAARARYASWGFTLTPKAQHPFGTANHLAQLDGNFLELLAIDDPAKISAVAPGEFGFAGFTRDFLGRREGFEMLVFESRDARADHAEFRAAGLASPPPFDFGRDARLPDGSTVRVGFSLAFVTDPRLLPEAAFFTCQQQAPQHFWKPDYQRHANTARQVTEVMLVAPEPTALTDLFAGMQSPGAVSTTGDGLSVATARGRISVLTPAAFARRFPGLAATNAPHTPHLAAFRVAVGDLAKAEAVVAASGTPTRMTADALQIAARDAFGTVLEFAAG